MHLNLLSCIKLLNGWINHVDLLVYFDLLNCLIVVEVKLLCLLQRVSNSNLILHLQTHLSLPSICAIDEVLFDAYDILDELLFSITFDVFNLCDLHLEQVSLLVHIFRVFLDKKVKNEFVNVRLQK
jgi:hypothetical protein